MAFTARKAPNAMLFALVAAFNLFIRWFTTNKTTYPHADVTSTPGGDFQAPTASARLVTAAAATSKATGITLGEDCRSVMLFHFADGGSAANSYGGAHTAADSANAADIAYGAIAKLTSTSSQAELNTLLNQLKATALAHVDEPGVHFADDATNTITAADATDLASSETLANAIATWVNAHVQFAGGAQTINLVAA